MAENKVGSASDFVGGTLAFDFANMSNLWQAPAMVDGRRTAENPFEWARSGGLIDDERRKQLEVAARQEARLSSRLIAMADDLRGAIFEVGVALATGREPTNSDIATLKDYYARSVAIATLRHDDRMNYAFEFTTASPEFTLLGPVALSAMNLLAEADKSRMKQCPSCGWLFIDSSKNRSRRWCDMATCGNRTKARNHRERSSAH